MHLGGCKHSNHSTVHFFSYFKLCSLESFENIFANSHRQVLWREALNDLDEMPRNLRVNRQSELGGGPEKHMLEGKFKHALWSLF